MSGVQFVNGRAESDRLRAEMNNAGATFDANLLSQLYYACFVGYLPDVMRLSANKTKEDLNKPETHMKFTSLLCVSSGSQRTTPNPHSNHVAVASFLLSKGANPNAQDTYGYTPVMHITSRQSRLDVAKVLLEGGADPNIRNRFGCVALHESVMASNDQACSLLCDFGADPNIKDVDGITPYRCSTAFPVTNMILTNAIKKLKGEKVVLLEDVKKCAQCNKPSSKRCSRCQIVSYCSADCQKLHWKDHKPNCKKPENYVSVDITNLPPQAKFLATISNKSMYGAMLDGERVKETDQLFTVKIQVDKNPEVCSPMLVYNKSKKFQTMITTENCPKYNELSRMIKTKGIMGLKGYFKSFMHTESELRILTHELLPQQPW